MAQRDRDDEASLSEAFWSVARELRSRSRESLAPWDVTPANFRAIGVLAHSGPMRLGDLAERLHIAARSATEVVDALEGRDLVERRPDPDDRRATLVSLTDQGRAMLTSLQSRRAAETNAFFGALSRTDRRDLLALLNKLIPRT